MNTRPIFWCALVALASLPVFLGGCQQQVGEPTGVTGEAVTGDSEGKATQMPAFFDGNPITVNMVEFPDGSEDAFLAQLDAGRGTTNLIFAVADLDEPQPFPPVVDEIQGKGFNPRWRQILVPDNTTLMLTSAAAIEAAACLDAAGNPLPNCTPTLASTVTDEFYRCSIVAPSPRPQ
jgi:hypothetical protein